MNSLVSAQAKQINKTISLFVDTPKKKKTNVQNKNMCCSADSIAFRPSNRKALKLDEH